MGFELARQPPPEAAALVVGAVAKRPDQKTIRLIGWLGSSQQLKEDLLHDIFGFAVRKAQRAAVQDQFGGLRLKQFPAPMFHLAAHFAT